MTDHNSQSPFSRIVTQTLENIQSRVNFDSFSLRQGATVAELRVKDGDREETRYPLLGDRYTIGRSPHCDIQILDNELVSQEHCSLIRNKRKPRSFIVRDENSTNGIYRAKKRFKTFSLYNGESFTLAPTELEDAVKISYYNPVPWWIKMLRFTLFGSTGVLGLLILWMGMEWSKVSVSKLPQGESRPIIVYSGEQVPINPVANNTHRELPRLKDFSPYLPQAVIASEDSRYYWHLGVDPYGIVRAIVTNLQASGLKQGASTITQQLARSLFPEVGRENTAARKLREMLVAMKLEAFYSKDEILKTYLNRVYLGVGLSGFEDAAQFYFEKSAKDLDISEAATLVAILPAPNAYNPVKDLETALALRNRVINRMEELGMITEAESDRARRSIIEVSPKARRTFSDAIAPYFYSYVLEELRSFLGSEEVKNGNFIVETALDPKLQKAAELSLANSINEDGSRLGFSQGAVVTLNSKTGEIVALVGGADYSTSQFNRATQAKRQPGSTFKIFAYAAAIANGINPNKEYSCNSVSWRGQRYRACERSSGNIDMYRGLAQSENAVALRVAQDVGLNRVVEMANNMGIESPLAQVPGLVLGQSEVSVLEITGSYGALANNGIWYRPHAIRRILDGSDCSNPQDLKTCREIYNFEKQQHNRRQAIERKVAKRMTNMLRQVVDQGTGRAAKLGEGEAGKTGTTDKNVDLWFIGYVPKEDLVTGIWLGNDDNSPTQGSSSQAARLWGKYMREFVD
ncbi:penicillin-binding protein, 1A family [Xenococcus sp. PCC 7305]|uniref:PBP1A family penicillin-binding protein n=1 Tax=Xenococcus sp. PCC 7305 TaxID=102125 RepID=UPI0002ACFED6|nr:PBP1A family penicillin-binding protein [Xenococcus sp. PCC 7305]ELS04269.1 penicillin-binding protein, 1A family [Xenococcus sp. PCC 7305]